MSVDLSVIIPVYNSRDGLRELHQRLILNLSKISSSFEIILVDDNSRDNSFEIMKQIREDDDRVHCIKLMRNFGQHNAIMCGFNYAQGRYIITMDDDLQNPPEEISKLYDKLHEGFDVVIGRPIEKKHSLYRNLGSKLIGLSYEKIFRKPPEIQMSSFRIISRTVIESIINIKTPNPMVDALILSTTLNIANVEVRHNERKHGKSNYSLAKSVKLALNLLMNYSTIPLQVISLNGFLFAFIGILIATYVIIGKLSGAITEAGWASIIALISIFSGIILVSFGIIGEYLIRIIGEVAHFRQFVIRESSYKVSVVKEDNKQQYPLHNFKN